MKDRWTELCEQAVTELDPRKFRAILQELNQLLDERSVAPRITPRFPLGNQNPGWKHIPQQQMRVENPALSDVHIKAKNARNPVFFSYLFFAAKLRRTP